jgi:hypothetical protein
MREQGKAALRFRNIAAYWRARAAKSKNAETQLRLNATAAHYENLAHGKKLATCPFSYASKQRVLLVSAGAIVDENTYLKAYDTTVLFIASRGPCSGIMDLSAVEDYRISPRFVSLVGTRKSVVPQGMSRFVVAPQEKVYDMWRTVELMRSSTEAPITVVRHIDHAFAHFGVTRSDFEEVFDAMA